MSRLPTLLLIDDDAEIRDQMKWALVSEYQIVEAADRIAALTQARLMEPALVLLDLGLPPDIDGATEGLAILRELLQLNPTTKVIVITGNSDRAKAIMAIDGGAYDFIEKPVRLEVLRVVLQRAAYLADLEQENRRLQQKHEEHSFEGLLGESPQMQAVFRMIRRVGTSEVPVLITGESGTGKELVARAIHQQSLRKDKAFVVINCGAIPETLLESELFGYERGAFTGATQQRKGRVEAAQGGTLFLDEIGDIPLGLQVKLLRFLQDHEIQRLGGKETSTIDIRILAATNVDLQKAIKEGLFREDLYYRLCVVMIPVPPLNRRKPDISVLSKAFLEKFSTELHKPLNGFTPQAMDALVSHTWPGNVRELENRVKRAVVMAEGRYITPENLELLQSVDSEDEGLKLRVARDSWERDLVRLAMEKAEGNISRAAAELGVSRPTLYQLLAKFGLKKPNQKL